MATIKQIEANRRNAQQSTGPKTPEGKAAVRLNALRHGLRARTVVLPGEQPEEFQQLCDDLETEWPPQLQNRAILPRADGHLAVEAQPYGSGRALRLGARQRPRNPDPPTQ